MKILSSIFFLLFLSFYNNPILANSNELLEAPCKPNAVCVLGLNVTLAPNGLVEVDANDVDNGSYSDCGTTITGVSFSPNPNDNRIIFTCNQKGSNFVQLWVTDSEGNQNFCETIINVQENFTNTCTNPDQNGCVPIAQSVVILYTTIPTDGGLVNIPASELDQGSKDNCGTNGISFSFSPNPNDANLTLSCDQFGSNFVQLWVTDGNGNQSFVETIIVLSEDPTTATVCNQSFGCNPLAISKPLNISLNGSKTALVEAADLASRSRANCNGTLTSLSFSATSIQSELVVNCDNLGTNFSNIYITDNQNRTSIVSSIYSVQDNCGVCNPNSSCAPAPYCIAGLQVDLTTDATVTLNAAMFDNGSLTNCGKSATTFSFSSDPTDQTRTFDCNQLGIQPVEIWVTEGEQQNFCSSFVAIQSNDANACQNPDPNSCTPTPVLRGSVRAALNHNGEITLAAVDFNVASFSECNNELLSFYFAPNGLEATRTFDCGDIGTTAINVYVRDNMGMESIGQMNLTIDNSHSNDCPSDSPVRPNILADNTMVVSLVEDGSITVLASMLALPRANANPNDALCYSFSSNVQDTRKTFNCDDLGSQSVELWATDINGQQNFVPVDITVQDNILACCSVSCPPEITVACNDSGYPPSQTGQPTATCTGTFEFTDFPFSNDNGCGLNRRFEFTNDFGVRKICFQTIDITDNDAPIVAPIDDFFVCDVSENCAAALAFPIPTVTECRAVYDIFYQFDLNNDNTVELNGQLAGNPVDGFSPLTLINVPYGTHRVIYFVSDGCGNVGGTSFNATIGDCKPPTTICQNATFTMPPNGSLQINANQLDNGSFDECSTPLQFSFSFNPDDKTIVYTCDDVNTSPTVQLWVTDASGNQSYCEATITINANPNGCDPNDQTCYPIVSCSALTVNLEADQMITLAATQFDNGSFSPCQAEPLDFFFNNGAGANRTFTCADLGTNTIELLITDSNGIQEVCMTTLTIQDAIDICNNPGSGGCFPTIQVAPRSYALDFDGNAKVSALDFDEGSYSTCDPGALQFSFSANPDNKMRTYNCFNIGTTDVLIWVTDGNGNQSYLRTTVTIQDNTGNCDTYSCNINQLELNESDVVPGQYVANDEINSQGTVNFGYDVNFQAENSITLGAGFSVQSGATFHAEVAENTADCNALQEEEVAFRQDTPANNKKRISELTAYPNPADYSTTLAYTLSQPATVEIQLHGLTGMYRQQLQSFANQESGEHRLNIDTQQLPNGIYYFVLRIDDKISTHKVVVMK